jgi:MOSC domain-containing protein YiiM
VDDRIALLAVNVGTPRRVGDRRGRPVRSAIAKRPVASGTELSLTLLNLAGDDQADRRLHGGPDKAVYAYPSEHLAAWRADLHEHDLGPAAFGENLTTAGALEDDVRIGDVWGWGDARLQVCQPRTPCFKLALHRGRGDVATRLITTGRTGWYLRVLVPGTVGVDGPVEVVERHPAAVTVLDAHRARYDRDLAHRAVERVVALGATLAEEWRLPLLDRVSRAVRDGR